MEPMRPIYEDPQASLPQGTLIGYPVEEILKMRGLVTQEQLDTARNQAELDETQVDEALLAQKVITEEQLLRARSEELDIPFCEEINAKEIDPALLEKVSISFAKQALVLPLSLDEEKGELRVACADPYDLDTFDQLRLLLNAEPLPWLAPETLLVSAINQAYDLLRGSFGFDEAHEELEDVGRKDDEFDDIDEAIDLLDASDDEAPVIRLVNSLIYRSIKERASDIHIEPFEKEVIVRFRIDGVLYKVISVPKRAQSHIIARIKIMSGLNIAEKRLPQDGRIRLKIAGKDVDIRVSTIPVSHGERAVMRLLDKSAVLLDIRQIGFAGELLDNMLDLISHSHGIILVTGPTGSGKTTTLYSCLSEINSPDKNILTCEDPIEYQLKGIGQMQVSSKIGLTFASGLRAFLRQDPDVILVGETRDQETAEIAIQASLTGHLVFTTVHTNDAPSAFTRLIDMGVDNFLVASSVIGVLAQRLMRRVCPTCREPYEPTYDEMSLLGLTPERLAGHTIYRASEHGCDDCLHVGYRGRVGIYELMLVDDSIRGMVMRNEPSGTIKKYAINNGMVSLRESGARKVLDGISTIAEVTRVTQEDHT
jgi:general secretion pathway protein E